MNSENKNLAGEKSKTVDPERYRQALINAHQNFIGLCWNQKLVDEFARLEEGMAMSVDAQDVLELLGNIEPLKLTEADKEDARRTIRRLLRATATRADRGPT